MASLIKTLDSSMDSETLAQVSSNDGLMVEIEDSLQKYLEEEEEAFPTEEVMKNMSFACVGVDSDSDEESDLPFDRISKKMTNITNDGGVKKMILRSGSGPVVPDDSIVRVHYNAYLELAAEPFDSTRLRDCASKFRLGSSSMMTGFDTAVSTMKKQELSRFLITPAYAFGDMGCPPRVPPHATVMMEIELLNYIEEGGVENYIFLTEEERSKITFEQLVKAVNSQKQEGNTLFKRKQWSSAVRCYKKAIKILEATSLKSVEEEAIQRTLLLKLYLNMSACLLRLNKHYPLVITLCQKSLELDSSNVKAMFRKAQAFRKLGNFGKAKEWLARAKNLEPRSTEISEEMNQLFKDMQSFATLEKRMYTKMFNSATTNIESEESQTSTTNSSSTVTDVAAVDSEFASMVHEKLGMFIASSDPVLPFPACALSIPQITYIMQEAREKQLTVIQKGEGYKMKLKIMKKPKEE